MSQTLEARRRNSYCKNWVGKIPWRRKCQPTSVFCLDNSMDRGTWTRESQALSKQCHGRSERRGFELKALAT